MYLLTTSPYKTGDSTGTTEIGLKSPGPVGVFVLATGRMPVTRHCSWMVEELSDRLKRRAIHPEQTGTRRRRNQAGMWSRPSAVGFSLSRMKKSCVWRCSCLEDRFQILGVCGCRGVERVHVLDRKWQISFHCTLLAC